MKFKDSKRYLDIKNEIFESIKSDLIPKPQPIEKKVEVAQPTIVVEEKQVDEIVSIKKDDLIDKVNSAITKLVNEQNITPLVEQLTPQAKSLEDLSLKMRMLEDWVSRISSTSPGGGAGDVINLDFPVKLVTSNYTITRKDYYVGVNALFAVTIILPDSIGFTGRKIIIKDESGNCASNPITVQGYVDNDLGGFILQNNNGGVQMIYREGWRII